MLIAKFVCKFRQYLLSCKRTVFSIHNFFLLKKIPPPVYQNVWDDSLPSIAMGAILFMTGMWQGEVLLIYFVPYANLGDWLIIGLRHAPLFLVSLTTKARKRKSILKMNTVDHLLNFELDCQYKDEQQLEEKWKTILL